MIVNGENQASSLGELYGAEQEKKGTVISASSEITVPRQIDVYVGLDITPKDKYIVDLRNLIYTHDKESIHPHVEIINAFGSQCGFFTLIESEEVGKYYLTATVDDIKELSSNNIEYSLDFVLKHFADLQHKNVPVKIFFHQTEETNEVLCIDFGTSNTAAGAYLGHDYITNICSSALTNGNVVLGEENIVKFDMVGNGSKYAEIVPTIVSCKDCGKRDKVDYRFGYAAYEELRKNNFCPNETSFLEIKRWVTDCEKNVRMIDAYGNTIEIKRKQIIRQYLLYIIHEAEQQFKCHFKNIHITSPVKLKKKYLEVFTEVLQEYKVEKEKAIDEGVAVLYSQIDEDIQNVLLNKNSNDNQISKKAIIIDCGGGTSDLASCQYDLSYDDDVIDVKIETSYINGDCNFGGNNLTYRIMQYMKIVYAYYYLTKNQKRKKDRRILIEQLIDDNTSNMIYRIDNCSDDEEAYAEHNRIYRKLNEEYEKAERIIPTKYVEYESQSAELYTAVRNNFFFLWNMADQMKKQFYQYDTITRYTISSDESEKDADLYVNPISSWKLTIRKDENNYQSESYPDIIFNAKEIAWLMTGDIYYLVHRFLHELYDEGTLMSYNSIKLSGQSTNIDTFKNGLKEFLPGKMIKINPDPTENPYELKLICLKGALKYIRALSSSDIDVDLSCGTDSLPFDVITNSNADEKIMISQKQGWNQEPGKVRIVSTAKNKEFVFKASDGTIINKPYRFDCENYEIRLKKKTIKEISDLTNRSIEQEYIDQLKKDKTYVITYLDKENWGFNIIIIKINAKGEIYSTEPVFCSFQSDVSQKTFFEGDC